MNISKFLYVVASVASLTLISCGKNMNTESKVASVKNDATVASVKNDANCDLIIKSFVSESRNGRFSGKMNLENKTFMFQLANTNLATTMFHSGVQFTFTGQTNGFTFYYYASVNQSADAKKGEVKFDNEDVNAKAKVTVLPSNKVVFHSPDRSKILIGTCYTTDSGFLIEGFMRNNKEITFSIPLKAAR